MDQSDYNTKPAHPGVPLEPDQLPESPNDFQTATQAVRSDESAAGPGPHPSTELDIRSGQKGGRIGKPSSGTHPTRELDVRRKR